MEQTNTAGIAGRYDNIILLYLPDNPGTPDVTAMLRNRLAQNRMMRRFCDERGIPLLDTTRIHVETIVARLLS